MSEMRTEEKKTAARKNFLTALNNVFFSADTSFRVGGNNVG